MATRLASHYRVLADLVDADSHLPDIAPGVLFEGDDLGKWLKRQKNPGTWAQLLPEQQERLSKLGVQPAEAPSPAPAATRAAEGARARHRRRSSGISRPSRSGWNARGRGRCPVRR